MQMPKKNKEKFQADFFVVITARTESKNARLFQNPFLKYRRFLGSSVNRGQFFKYSSKKGKSKNRDKSRK
jgi:hypothetical protein